MAKCADCGKEMDTPETEACTCDILYLGDAYYRRSTWHFNETTGRCHDCNVKHGGVHHFGCLLERCPKCGHFITSCDCGSDIPITLESSRLLQEEPTLKFVDPVAPIG